MYYGNDGTWRWNNVSPRLLLVRLSRVRAAAARDPVPPRRHAGSSRSSISSRWATLMHPPSGFVRWYRTYSRRSRRLFVFRAECHRGHDELPADEPAGRALPSGDSLAAKANPALLVEQRNTLVVPRLRNRLQIGVDVGEVCVREDRLLIRRHRAV